MLGLPASRPAESVGGARPPRAAARAASVGGRGAPTPLVINTESADPPSEARCAQSRAVAEKTALKPDPRADRYLLQQTARKLLPGHRVRGCLWWLARGALDVGVEYSSDTERARYRRLLTCGSVWACPVCASHVTERRAEELRSMLAALHDQGGSAAFATFTVSHTHEDALETVLEGFLASFRYLTSKPSYKRLRVRCGVVGYVRVLEVTHGRNGWHVHAHVLYFFGSPLDAAALAAFEDALYPLWESAAGRQGLTMSRRYGLEVKPSYGSVEEYVTKFGWGPRWDISREMTKGHIKRGRTLAGVKHLTPWELLAAAQDGDDRCGALFRQYVERFDGKAQLYYSPGLRARYLPAVEDLSDSEIAATGDTGAVEVGAIPSALWESVKRAGGRVRVLQLVEEAAGSWALVEEYLAGVVVQFPPYVRPAPGLMPPELRAALDQLHEAQRERNRWRGPLPPRLAVPEVVSSSVGGV